MTWCIVIIPLTVTPLHSITRTPILRIQSNERTNERTNDAVASGLVLVSLGADLEYNLGFVVVVLKAAAPKNHARTLFEPYTTGSNIVGTEGWFRAKELSTDMDTAGRD